VSAHSIIRGPRAHNFASLACLKDVQYVYIFFASYKTNENRKQRVPRVGEWRPGRRRKEEGRGRE